jgi:hypothetical protein
MEDAVLSRGQLLPLHPLKPVAQTTGIWSLEEKVTSRRKPVKRLPGQEERVRKVFNHIQRHDRAIGLKAQEFLRIGEAARVKWNSRSQLADCPCVKLGRRLDPLNTPSQLPELGQ